MVNKESYTLQNNSTKIKVKLKKRKIYAVRNALQKHERNSFRLTINDTSLQMKSTGAN